MATMQGSGYRPAAICKRGHVATSDVTVSPDLASTYCPVCGAGIIRNCPDCGHFIRGDYHVPGWVGAADYTPPDFCEDCGSPFPWLSREGRIYMLRNILEASEVDEAAKLRAREQLEALSDPELDEEEQARRWARFKKAAPAVWAGEQAQRIIGTVLEAGTRAMVEKYAP
jgi:hypothetical protein